MIRALLVAAALAWTAAAADVSTFISGATSGMRLARDSGGNILVANGVLDPAGKRLGLSVLKVDPSGTRILYTWSLWLDRLSLSLSGIAAAPDGGAVVICAPSATDPAEPPATSPSVFRLNASGGLAWSKSLSDAGEAFPTAVAVNAAGEIFIAGSAGGAFPVTPDLDLAVGQTHPFVMKLDQDGNRVFAVSGLGGSHIAFDPAGDIYLAGFVTDSTYPTTPGAYSRTFPFEICSETRSFGIACLQTFVSKLHRSGNVLLYSTFLPAKRGSVPGALAVDAAGYAYAGVNTEVTDYPVTPGAYNYDRGGCVTKLNQDGSGLVWSACLGRVTVRGLGLEPDGSVTVGGSTGDAGRCQYDPASAGPYVARLSADGAALTSLRTFGDPTAGVTSAIAVAPDAMVLAGTSRDGARYANHLALNQSPSEYGTFLLTLTAGVPLPPRRLACIQDGADWDYVSTVTPGQLLTVFGTGLDTAEITVNGTPAPAIYRSAGQVNIVVPHSVRNAAIVRAAADGSEFFARTFTVAARNPTMLGFPVTYSPWTPPPPRPSWQGVINPDGTSNSQANPALTGSLVSLYVHAVGATGTEAPDGSINPVPPAPLNLPIEISDARIKLVSAVQAVNQVSGIWELILQLPADPAPDGYIAFDLKIGGAPLRQGSVVVWYRPPR